MTTEKIWESLGALPPVLWAISTPTCLTYPTCLTCLTCPTCPTSRRQYTATFAASKVQLLNPSQYIPIPTSTQARYPTATLPSASVLLRRDKQTAEAKRGKRALAVLCGLSCSQVVFCNALPAGVYFCTRPRCRVEARLEIARDVPSYFAFSQNSRQ